MTLPAPSPAELRRAVLAIPLLVECPHCWAAAGERCSTLMKRAGAKRSHKIRQTAAARHLAGLLNDPIGRPR